MRVVILAAGQSRRFQEAGYMTPKPFLLINYRSMVMPMIWHVIYTVPLDLDITVIVPEGQEKIVSNIPYWSKITAIPVGPTIGPAHTAQIAMEKIGYTENVIFLDSDVLNTTNDIDILAHLTDNGVLVTKSTNPNSSYVDKMGDFTRIKEKERISEYAVCGAYSFGKYNMEEFHECLDKTVNGFGEPFLSHVLDKMNGPKLAFNTIYTPIDWGTPYDIAASGAKIVEE